MRLDDGSLFVLDADHPAVAQLSLGTLLTEELLFEIRDGDESCRCRRKALELLARAEQCRRGLEQKLSKRGFGPGAIEAGLNRLEAAGLLDDARFAQAWVRFRLRRHPEGPSKLQAALMAKGIAGDVALRAVQTILQENGDEDADEALERAWKKLARKSGMSGDSLAAALLRRGFAAHRVQKFLRARQGE